jgi:hypothetical protein
MMDRLDFLVRRFRQIVPHPLTGWDPVRGRQLRCWLREDVGPVLEDLVRRPRFRAQAAWPVRTLRPGAGTAERALVEDLDAALAAQGRALRRLARRPRVRERLETVAVEQVVAEEEVLLGSGSPQGVRRVHGPVDRLGVFLVQLDRIAGRFWQDLVCLGDYFEPSGGWGTGRRPGGQPGEFVVALNPELHPGGDFVSRCLCRRVEGLLGTLRDFLRFGDEAFRLPGAGPPKGWAEVSRRHRDLALRAEQLRRACLRGEQQPLRDACILLTQAHAGLCPGADLGWLGLPEGALRGGAPAMGHRLQSCHGELLERLAASLGGLKELYADSDARQSAIEEAAAAGGLVVVRPGQHVYWEGRLLAVAWSRYHALWRLLVALAEKGQRGAAVTDRDLYDHATALSTLATTLSRLRKLVPASLWKHVVPSKDPRGYRLQLDRHHIHLF